MKTIIFILFAWLVSFSTPVLADTFTEIQYEYQERSSTYTKTPYTYKDKKGELHLIWINKSNGRCCIRKEYFDGDKVKYRNQYLNETISRDVAKKMNIPYTYVKKS